LCARAWAILDQRAWIALPGDQRLHHGPPGDAVQIRERRRDFDLGILEQLFDPLPLAGAVLHQGPAVAGQITQPTDLGRLHQRGSAHAPLGHFGEPDRIGAIFSELNRS
jgi:hypothetical protein